MPSRAHLIFEDEMNQLYGIISLSLLFLVFGCACADSLSSSIVCTGAAWVSSSVIGPGTSFSEHLFTTDPAFILRDLLVREGVETTTRARSSGPLGIDEYSSGVINQTGDPDVCVFDRPMDQNTPVKSFEHSVLGLMQEGMYTSSRQFTKPDYPDNGRIAMSVNGTGMILTRARSTEENQTISMGSDVAGDLNMTEVVKFGEDHDT